MLAFINYRAEDTGGVAFALEQSLLQAFGEGSVFLDHRNIEPGEPWPDRLRDAVDSATHVLVLIGEEWLTLQGAYGQRRLDNPKDWVRLEIASALARGKRVVPLLVDETEPLVRDALEMLPDIVHLADLQARPLVIRNWGATFGELQRFLEKEGFSALPTESGKRPLPVPFRSNVPPRGKAPFVGRAPLLIRLVEVFASTEPTQLVVLHGPSGAGKSELAREYARTQQSRYPGGTFVVDVRSSGPPHDLARIGRTVFGLAFAPELTLEDQCIQALLAIAAAPCLLIYDNAPSPQGLDPWLPRAGQPCHLLVTSTWERWDPRWQTVAVAPLADSDARMLVEQVAGPELARRHGERLVELAGGLPVQLLPAAQILSEDERRGHAAGRHLLLTAEAKDCFSAAWVTLDEDARLTLAAASHFHPERIARGVLREALAASSLDDPRVDAAIDRCADLFLLQPQGQESLRMHQLWGRFVREQLPALESTGRIEPLHVALVERLLEAARAVQRQPGNSDAARRLLSFASELEIWRLAGVTATTAINLVARALVEIGRFEEALDWYERAAEKAKGNVDGRVDHESLGSTLHNVGFCLSSMGRFEEARDWYERAVAETEKGDVHARVDHENLGRSLHEVGICLSSMGRFEEARDWFERAVAEKEKGAVHSRLHHDSYGASLHQVGFCLSSLGRFEEARDWYERAVAVKEDVYGRMNHDSIGKSLYEVGFCLSSVGRFEEARDWYERAATEVEKGDVHGRVDHNTLGRSLHRVGCCLSSLDRFEEARDLCERAVAEAQKGDVHGRVDHETLGRSLHQVGCCLEGLGRIDEARGWFERAIAEKEKGDVYARVDAESLAKSREAAGR